jgi:hypothetical protein
MNEGVRGKNGSLVGVDGISIGDWVLDMVANEIVQVVGLDYTFRGSESEIRIHTDIRHADERGGWRRPSEVEKVRDGTKVRARKGEECWAWTSPSEPKPPEEGGD